MKFFIGDKEQRLSRRLCNGESAARQEFYNLYADYLSAICARYVADEDDLKDVFQDCMVSILTGIGRFEYRGAGSLQAWATRVAVNQSLTYLKTKKKNEMLLLDGDVAADAADDISEPPPISNVPPEELHRMVSQLPTGYRTVLNLYVFENKSHKEIAQLLGIKADTSASQLHRAKHQLAKMIKEYNSKRQPR